MKESVFHEIENLPARRLKRGEGSGGTDSEEHEESYRYVMGKGRGVPRILPGGMHIFG